MLWMFCVRCALRIYANKRTFLTDQVCRVLRIYIHLRTFSRDYVRRAIRIPFIYYIRFHVIMSVVPYVFTFISYVFNRSETSRLT